MRNLMYQRHQEQPQAREIYNNNHNMNHNLNNHNNMNNINLNDNMNNNNTSESDTDSDADLDEREMDPSKSIIKSLFLCYLQIKQFERLKDLNSFVSWYCLLMVCHNTYIVYGLQQKKPVSVARQFSLMLFLYI